MSAAGRDENLSSARVLIVDDQPANVALLERLLRRMGIERITGVTDPRDALANYQAMKPDLILIDLHMPHIGGLGLLEILGREIPPDSFVPVVVLTADGTDRAKQDALGAGATDFLTKPFDHTEVVLRVTNLLRTRRLHTTLQRHNADLQSELRRRAEIERRLAEQNADRIRRVRDVIQNRSVQMLFQPIIKLSSGSLVGVEALARFPAPPRQPPDQWFAEAASVGMGTDLELAAITAALQQFPFLPPDSYLALNVSPATVIDPRLTETIRPYAQRIVIELTEHEAVDGYASLLAALTQLRTNGVRVAVDDAGSGYAGLRHILRVRPDIIKLDLALTRDIHADPARRALAASLVSFGRETGASIVAEGIETPEEFDTLRSLRVEFGQGFHLGRPAPLPRLASENPATAL